MTKLTKRACGALAALAACAVVLAGCGGGGGGGSATVGDVTGRVLLIGIGDPIVPDPPATVSIPGAGSVQTATDGTFTIRGVRTSATQITVTATGYVTLTQPLPALAAGATNDLGTLFLSDTGYTAEVAGTVVRSDTQEAVAGAVVMLNGLRTVTLASGQFSFSNLPEGLGGPNVVVGTITATGLETKPIVIDLPLGASPPVNDLGVIPMSPPVSDELPPFPTNIRGKVTLTGVSDFTGVTVTLLKDGAAFDTYTTVANGVYGFWVPAGAYTLRAERTGFTTVNQAVTLARIDQPVTVNLTLSP